MLRHLPVAGALLWAAWPAATSAEVLISELSAAASDRLLRWEGEGLPRLGHGAAWYEAGFDDSAWSRGTGPLGMGRSGLSSNLTAHLAGRTPALYLRTTFPATAAQAGSSAALRLTVRAADGFVAYLNGREVARRNLGPEGLFIHEDMEAFRTEEIDLTLSLGTGANGLREGSNLLAVQVHNQDVADGTLHFSATLQLASVPAVTLLGAAQSWAWRANPGEPSGGLYDPLIGETDFSDWVELHNRGDQAVNLQGWSLSDDQKEPTRFVFPSVAIPAGGRLVLLADGQPTPSGGAWRHLPFNLTRDGEFLGLYQPSGVLADSVEFPVQDSFHSYGRATADDAWRFFPEPTPGAENPATGLAGRVEPVVLSAPGGFYDGPVTITLSCATPGAELRYTTDGREPTREDGQLYTTALTFPASTVLRGRAFADGLMASRVRTATYLLDQPAERLGLPAVALAGDPARDLFQPFGVTAIQGGEYINSGANRGWQSTGPEDYNLPLVRGRLFERAVSFEWLSADGQPARQEDAGLRIAASTAERPFLQFDNLGGQWSVTEAREKPSFNVFFRDDYEGRLNHEIIPGGRTNRFASLRLRSGKNDITSPFVTDEVVRRLTDATGQATPLGRMATLYVNAVFRGYYNLTERVTEDSLQDWHESDADWNVIKGQAPQQAPAGTPWVTEEGSDADFRQLLDFLRGADLSQAAAYQTATEWVDLTNLVDYLLPSLWAGVLDWHMNNWVAARAQVDGAPWRFYVWDAEWGFNLQPSHWILPSTDYINSWLLSPGDFTAGVPLTILFTRLRENAEFRRLFADRVQRHFFHGGALTEARVQAEIAAQKSALYPLQVQLLDVELKRKGATDAGYKWYDSWINGGRDPNGSPHQGRNAYFFPHLRQHGLWPETLAPVPSLEPGSFTPGTALDLANPNPAGTVYAIFGGGDPRGPDGQPTVPAWAGPVSLQENTRLVARVLQGEEWSPLLDLTYLVPLPHVQIAEIHYHPADAEAVDGDQLEFLEIENSGDGPADLGGTYFGDGVTFLFAAGTILEPGARLVLVSDPAAFASRYPGVTVFGQYGGNLSNGGERLTLNAADGRLVDSVTYDDVAPWPVEADGAGFSLVPPLAGPRDGSVPWRRGAFRGGSPGEADPADFGAALGTGTWAGSGGLVRSDWFGLVLGGSFPWIWQEHHGWLYALEAGGDALWCYDLAAEDWTWTTPAVYPFLYFARDGRWRSYLAPTLQPRWFYEYGGAGWITLP